MRLKLTLAYDGKAFRGWQSQPGGGAVQDVLQEAFAKVSGGAKCPVQGSGRTDAGVHAYAQVAHANVPEGRLAPSEWQKALNAILPPGLRIMRCRRVADKFHARFAATGKTYEYLLWTGAVLPPHLVDRAWHVIPAPDVKRIRSAAKILRGRHDFRAFSANRGTPVAETVRDVRSVTVRQEGNLVRLRFSGEGFLYKMVRMMAAALVRVGQGKSSLDELRTRLLGNDSKMPRDVAPAGGLYLVRVTHARLAQSS
jgi:tRNA pseudouridine38-40 synthase